MPRIRAKTVIALDRAWTRWKGSLASFMARLDRDNIPYLSHSKVSLFERCQCCYYRQYVLGEQDESLATRLGSLFHEAARGLYTARSKVASRDLLGRLKTRGLDPERHRQLRNAVILLCQNRWLEHAIISVETPFFMDLAPGLRRSSGLPT